MMEKILYVLEQHIGGPYSERTRLIRMQNGAIPTFRSREDAYRYRQDVLGRNSGIWIRECRKLTKTHSLWPESVLES
jgi:hypothetical protein